MVAKITRIFVWAVMIVRLLVAGIRWLTERWRVAPRSLHGHHHQRRTQGLFDKGKLRLRWPGLFTIAPCKNKSVHDELQNDTWILAQMNRSDQLWEFIDLASTITSTILEQHVQDSVS